MDKREPRETEEGGGDVLKRREREGRREEVGYSFKLSLEVLAANEFWKLSPTVK